MTEFKQHDRLKVVDATPRTLMHGRQLKLGEIVTAASDQRTDAVSLVGYPKLWRTARFELVEHAVAEDRNGKPLYVGDHVRRISGFDETKPYETKVGPQGNVLAAFGEGFIAADPGTSPDGMACWMPKECVELVHHHWEPEPSPKLHGPIVEGHPVGAGSFMVLKRDSALAWGHVDGWSVRGPGASNVTVSLTDATGKRAKYDLAEWEVSLHHPATPATARQWNPIHWGFDGIELIELKMPKLDLKQLEAQIGKYADLFAAVNRIPEPALSMHSVGRAIDVPIFEPAPISWSDLKVGAEVTLKHRKMERTEAVGTVESLRGSTSPAHIPSVKLRGVGGSFYANNWEITTLKLPPTPLPTTHTSIVAPRQEEDKSRAILLNGQWYFTTSLPRVTEYAKTDPTQWNKGFRVIFDAGKDS